MKLSFKLTIISLCALASFNARESRAAWARGQQPWTMPGITTASPVGWGANGGQMYVGAGYQNRARYNTQSDGFFGLGLGLGNSSEYVGLDVSVSVLDVSSFSNGGLNLKLHRALPEGFAVAVGAESVAKWGSGVDSRDQAYYGTVSKIFFMGAESDWFSALTLTAGIGNGRFRSEADRNSNASTIGVFGAASVRVKEPVSLIADWTGQNLNVGLSFTPFREVGLFINPTLADVLSSSGDGARFIIGGGLALTYM